MEAWSTEMVVGEVWKMKCATGAWKRDLILVVPSPLAIVITKMSFCHSELQKYHS